MRRDLLLTAIMGFALCIFSFAVSLARPTDFGPLSLGIAKAEESYGLSREGRDMLDSHAENLYREYSSEVSTYSTAWYIALGGLFIMSSSCLMLYVYHRKKSS